MRNHLKVGFGLVLIGMLGVALGISREAPARRTIKLERAVYFLSSNGADTVLTAGVYEAEAKDERFIKVTPVDGGETTTIQALASRHEERISAPGTLTMSKEENSFHVVILMPGGKALDAVGSFDAASTRSLTSVVPLQLQQLRARTLGPDTPAAVVALPPPPLTGWVDMHTHPMSHLAFGKKLLHGAPDASIGPDGIPNGSIVPAGTRNCNPADFRASNINEALGNCNSTHGGWGTDNTCGNYIRAIAISKALDGDFAFNVDHNPFSGGNLHGDHRHEGIETSPNSLYWPHQTSKVHQQMWWEWIKRAYQEGGLRVMVALTVNSELLAEVVDGDEPKDDMHAADLQIDEIRSFVGRHNDFMEIAYTSADLRRIVGGNKLAVIVGMEIDNIGNFNKPGMVVNEKSVRDEIQRLYGKGVRYVFPIHLVDNKFGGTAIYEDLFDLANKYSTGKFYSIQTSSDPLITYTLGVGLDGLGNLHIKPALDAASDIPFPPSFNGNPFDSRFCISPIPFAGRLGCWEKFKRITDLLKPDPAYIAYPTTPGGHVNANGLEPMGKIAIKKMMELGMLIDIDHMSEKSINDTLTLAEQFGYPVNIGHNGIRTALGTERDASRNTTARVAALGGVFGVGTANTTPQDFIASFSTVWSAMGNSSVAIGTDVNGMERLPRASEGLNSTDFYSGFPKSATGNRTWDYTKEGVAHYGLMADFLKDVKAKNVTVYNNLMKSAESFARMWERSEAHRINPSPVGGMMILSDTNSGLAMNAYGGAVHGTYLKLVNNCSRVNPDCTWTYRDGMILSDTNPGLAVNAFGGARQGTELRLVNNCTKENTDCTWTYRKGMFVSDSNPNLAINAYGGAVNGTSLKLVSNCTEGKADCTWTQFNAMLLSDSNATLGMNAYGGARHGAVLTLVNNCAPDNSDCTWTFRKGMLLSAANPNLAMNAYGGARHGTELKLVNNCQSNNSDCTWAIHKGMLLSDRNASLAMNAYGGARHGTVLRLISNCPPNNSDCTWTRGQR